MKYYRPSECLDFDKPLSWETEKALLAKFYSTGSTEARDELIRYHLAFTAKTALRLARQMMPDDDAISIGNFALVEAIVSKKFRIDGPARLSTYVAIVIREKIMKALREKYRHAPSDRKDVFKLESEELLRFAAYHPPELGASDREYIQKVIDQMPHRARILIRGLLAGFSREDIRETLGVTRQAVSAMEIRWKDYLRNKLREFKNS